MSRQPLSPARQLFGLHPHQDYSQNEVLRDAPPDCVQSRLYFGRTALFTALTSSLVGFGVAPAMAAEAYDLAKSNNNSAALSDAQLDTALDALRLKKAVDAGIIDQSVLEDYSQQNLGANPKNPPKKSSNNNLQQQATSVQQQGYQMMTPEQIEREIAAVNAANNQSNRNNINNRNNSGFDAPVATLDGRAPPIGLDVSLDAATLPAPTNLETLGLTDSAKTRAENTEIMARPINVSDAVTTGGVDASADITQQANPTQILAQQNATPSTEADKTTGTDKINGADNLLNPEDYLPSYEESADTQAGAESMPQGSKPPLGARNDVGFIKRTYNRLFNGGYMGLPHVKTVIYLQQDAAVTAVNGTPKLIKADNDIQPINNIKAALDDTTVQSVVDFTAALPRLRQTALDAAKAVGYYDVTLRLRQPNSDTIEVIIEKLGEPVRVDSRIVNIRGAGSEQAEFKALEQNLPPQEGDIFNHGIYKDSKAALESVSDTYGYFDQYWLNKSVDIILPDNTADVSLVYNTGDRYEFDEVVFFTYDKASGTLTQDPNKLPVEPSLLRQLYNFKAGDPFYRPDIAKFSNDLSATRYFNTVNVETIVPPDDLSATSTLAFDNSATSDNGGIDSDVNSNNALNALNATDSSNANTDNNISTASVRSDNDLSNNNRTDNGVATAAKVDDNTNTNANSGATVNAADIAPINFEVDEETYEKLAAIKQKADRLSRLPNDRVLDEKTREADSILGKISDSISNVAKKIFPDEKLLIADEDFVSPTLAGRKTPEQVQASKKIPLYVFVYADKPRDAQVGIGYGTDTGVRATGKIDYNLINRQGYQAGAEVAISRINKNATIYGSRPWNHPLNDKLEARLTYEEETIDQGEGSFDLSTQTLKAALARNIHRENGWDSSYFVRYRLDQLETGVDDADLEDLPVRFVSSNPKQQALLLGYGISKTTVDNVTNPTRGYRQYYGIEAGADKAFSDTDLVILRAGVSGIYSFGEDKKHQVLGSLNGGYIWADDFYDVPYKLRFFAGGDQSIRGYDYNSLSAIDKGYLTGGQILAVGSAEYNYEFKPGFRGAVFSDVGNAYDKDFTTDTKIGVGAGIRWASPVGVVRVDVAAGVTEEDIPIRLHFFIGSPL